MSCGNFHRANRPCYACWSTRNRCGHGGTLPHHPPPLVRERPGLSSMWWTTRSQTPPPPPDQGCAPPIWTHLPKSLLIDATCRRRRRWERKMNPSLRRLCSTPCKPRWRTPSTPTAPRPRSASRTHCALRAFTSRYACPKIRLARSSSWAPAPVWLRSSGFWNTGSIFAPRLGTARRQSATRYCSSGVATNRVTTFTGRRWRPSWRRGH